MENAKEMVEDFIRNYKEISIQNKLPSLNLEMKSSKDEFYDADYCMGTFQIQASNPLVSAYAIHSLKIAALSGHHADFLGKMSPKFNLRPLWIECDLSIQTESDMHWAIPNYLGEVEQQIIFAKRMISLGYNAIILGARDHVLPKQAKELSLEKICRTFQHFGIKVILKPIFSEKMAHLNEHIFLEEIKKIDSFDYLFIESGSVLSHLLTSVDQRELTSADQALYEVRFFEKILGNQYGLIYSILSRDGEAALDQAMWLPHFCDDVGAHTIIAFSAVSDDPINDHAPPHPIWDVLRELLDVSATPLMPILNVGGIHQGEGLWPSLAVDCVDHYYSRCQRHHFAGIIHLVNHLPHPGAVLDCSLWVASQAAWSHLSAVLLAETWFAAYYPEMNYRGLADIWKKNREIAIELSAMRSLTNEKNRDKISSEECKALSESLLARLHYLQEFLRRDGGRNQTFNAYCTSFIRDAKRIIHHFLQCFNVSIGYSLKGEDFAPSFWTAVQEGGGQGLRGGAKILFLDKPNQGEENNQMNQIYKANRLFT
ncbi:putative uncharacterized protein [Parachlamydia acanthamoebae UV-7]|jgi:hypothetical protein|uniref:Uncharacterized protein n=2 Tax=Parachlamydia acanthamoebae TaxID=83552 RepID=F8L1V7_PARAV|nr:hypothetical protein [Parachlamydia acanthamoebae]EFB40567.1 hypothetical protein pah_c200o141 [Parachlamydia acanthamoebae str. Hall's coccus]CCB87271.1 putative uncharacterized protein [Parachlamydia acanthamoebae UV-7]